MSKLKPVREKTGFGLIEGIVVTGSGLGSGPEWVLGLLRVLGTHRIQRSLEMLKVLMRGLLTRRRWLMCYPCLQLGVLQSVRLGLLR